MVTRNRIFSAVLVSLISQFLLCPSCLSGEEVVEKFRVGIRSIDARIGDLERRLENIEKKDEDITRRLDNYGARIGDLEGEIGPGVIDKKLKETERVLTNAKDEAKSIVTDAEDKMRKLVKKAEDAAKDAKKTESRLKAALEKVREFEEKIGEFDKKLKIYKRCLLIGIGTVGIVSVLGIFFPSK